MFGSFNRGTQVGSTTGLVVLHLHSVSAVIPPAVAERPPGCPGWGVLGTG